MQKLTSLFLLPLVFGLVTACASTPSEEENALAREAAKQENIKTPEQMLNRAAESFSNIEGLPAGDREKLASIYTKTYLDSVSIRKEIGQHKALLFKTLARKDYKQNDVKMIKDKIVSLDQKRLDVMFKALDDIQGVIGKGSPAADEIYKRLERYEYPMARDNY